MVDRLVHHAEVLVLMGDSYRLKGKTRRWWVTRPLDVSSFQQADSVQLGTGLTRAFASVLARHDGGICLLE
jgi:hypothetical protein